MTAPHFPHPLANAEDIALLERAIDEAGVSARRFAEDIVARDERTVRRWLHGERPIPVAIRRFLARRLDNPLTVAAEAAPDDDERLGDA